MIPFPQTYELVPQVDAIIQVDDGYLVSAEAATKPKPWTDSIPFAAIYRRQGDVSHRLISIDSLQWSWLQYGLMLNQWYRNQQDQIVYTYAASPVVVAYDSAMHRLHRWSYAPVLASLPDAKPLLDSMERFAARGSIDPSDNPVTCTGFVPVGNRYVGIISNWIEGKGNNAKRHIAVARHHGSQLELVRQLHIDDPDHYPWKVIPTMTSGNISGFAVLARSKRTNDWFVWRIAID